MVIFRLALAFLPLCGASAVAKGPSKPEQIESRFLHLRSGPVREWSSFPETADAQRLELSFSATKNAGEVTLRLRQQDVKQPWFVILNDTKVGELARDENDLVLYLPVPPGLLTDGDNRLVIEASPPRVAADSDDIRVGQIELVSRPRSDALSEATVELQVHDAATGGLLPCRITIVDDQGSMHSMSAESTNNLAVRPGVVYAATGRARFGLPAGKYTIYAGRGFEWSVAQVRVTLQPGDVLQKVMAIRREVPTEGYVACDPHVHTLTHSGHGDATLTERMFTLAGEGIELPIATDHNVHVDYRDAVERAGVARYFTPVIGNEVTTSVGHFNVFPVGPRDRPPEHSGKSWPEVFAAINRLPNKSVVVLNHARDLHSGFRPFGPDHFNAVAGEQFDGWPIAFNAMEVVNSGAVQTDPLQLFHDWMAMLNGGHVVTPIGSSDSHDVARFIVGQGRTYVRAADEDSARIDVEAAFTALRQGRVMVSYGLLAELTANGEARSGDLCHVEDELEIEVRVLGPHWASADRVRLFANGCLVRDELITKPSSELPPGVKWHARWKTAVPKHDQHLVAIATGPGINEPFWPMAKPYQPTSPEWSAQAIGCSGAVWIDGDGDARRTHANEYAGRAIQAAEGDKQRLIESLGSYDQAIATQAAHHLFRAGEALESQAWTTALLTAPLHVREGFQQDMVTIGRTRRSEEVQRRPSPK